MRPRLLALLPLSVLTASASFAQTMDARRAGVTVSGIVHDSIAGLPLSGATVQIVSADTDGHFAATRSTDSTGRYEVHDVPAGRYVLGFLHPLLDSIGIEPLLREIR